MVWVVSLSYTYLMQIFEAGNGHIDDMIMEVDEDPGQVLVQLARDIEAFVLAERETFSPVLKQWHPCPAAIAAATVHECFGVVLKQYLAKVTNLTISVARVLQSAGKLEKLLVQTVMDDCVDCDDGGKGIIKQMTPYEVDSIVTGLLKSWYEERLKMAKDCINRAKETEVSCRTQLYTLK